MNFTMIPIQKKIIPTQILMREARMMREYFYTHRASHTANFKLKKLVFFDFASRGSATALPRFAACWDVIPDPYNQQNISPIVKPTSLATITHPAHPARRFSNRFQRFYSAIPASPAVSFVDDIVAVHEPILGVILFEPTAERVFP